MEVYHHRQGKFRSLGPRRMVKCSPTVADLPGGGPIGLRLTRSLKCLNQMSRDPSDYHIDYKAYSKD